MVVSYENAARGENRAMFIEVQPPSSFARRYRAVGLSVAAHLALLAAILFHNPKIIDLTPTWVANGEGSHTYQIVYVAPGNDAAADAAKLLLPANAPAKPRPRPHPKAQAPKPAPHERPLEANAEASDHSSRAGSPLGTVLDGPISGHEVRIALPQYPEPQVDRANLPRNLQGDVVIEVTIDADGNVVATKIVQSIGHEIDEKIEAALRRRHYQPATLDGTPVASRQDVHFHFPS